LLSISKPPIVIPKVHLPDITQAQIIVSTDPVIRQDIALIRCRLWENDSITRTYKHLFTLAIVIVCDTLPEVIVTGVTYIQVKDTNSALAFLAANFYGNPSQNLKLIGITGTNGKTTIASLLYQLFQKAGYKVGLLSTVKIMVDDKEYKATHTTPDSLTINYYLAEMNEMGVEYCFMEVSSHGIHQKRTEALYFEGGVFTNLSHDHLDYHPTFADYRDVKKLFFDYLPKSAFALTNIDDKNGLVMIQNTVARKLTYALKSYADYKAQILENQLSGLLLKILRTD
jgi:UDP-N-acetylmuramoyl-L-alanyl-D-glutamate--2,6-diaminopimelate ligase